MSNLAERTWSPKTIAAGVASFLVPTLIVLVDYLLGEEGRALLEGWPVIAQLALLSLLTTAGTVLAAYVRRDPLRDRGAEAVEAAELH